MSSNTEKLICSLFTSTMCFLAVVFELYFFRMDDLILTLVVIFSFVGCLNLGLSIYSSIMLLRNKNDKDRD